MSNFRFLQKEWPDIQREATEAESLVYASPKACAIICRSALEKAVLWLYANDPELTEPYDRTLSSLMHAQCFKDILKPSLFNEINLVRKFGNNAAHGSTVKSAEAMVAVKNLFRFLSFLALYYAETEPIISAFDEGLIPSGERKDLRLEELRQLETKLEVQNDRVRLEREELEKKASEIEAMRQELLAREAEVLARKEEREKTHVVERDIPALVPEHLTRKLYIDQTLREAGWDNLREGYELEYEVRGMPASTNPSGVGYADYVLWGENGRPLAVIEAKRTMVDSRSGRHQATLYADCLERMHGQRPIIYYTNGFETFLWDDTFGPERRVHGFMTRDELQLAIDRRKDRTDIRQFRVNTSIVGRKYQMEAIKRVAEEFVRTDERGSLVQGGRKALLVMATGSGKTRTAAAIVDMLTKCNWAKRVLFLADRNALVTQAKNAFSEHLPHLSAIDLTKEKEVSDTRLVFSTYPTVMNKIDGVRTDDNRFYGVGHFDLIIIDEAHRSVYQKYGAIFDYFDALLVGLTATPKKEIDHNTYGLFEIEDDNPTFAYELDSAVSDGFLVPPKAMSVPVKFLRQGIKYSELSEKDKEEYERKFGDPTLEEAPEEIGSAALNQWLFNTGTVDIVLDHLMQNGIKVQGGDRLGKTIVFAKNHEHAIFIEERFNRNYPNYKGHFLRVIDNYESKAQDLLEKFVDHSADNDPQIAVSVDMMDTGVDAPRVVNLVFFKQVKSLTKFWQMVGRGTRLYPNLFGPGEDKEHFAIFDFCENLEFFEVNPEGIEGNMSKGMVQRIFELKLDVAVLIREKDSPTSDERELAEHYVAQLHAQTAQLDHQRFDVRMKLRHAEHFSHRENWADLSAGDIADIKEHLSRLMLPEAGDHELSRRFDLVVLAIQTALLEGRDGTRHITRVISTAKALTKKGNIPAVAARMPLIGEVQTEKFWNEVNPKRLEELRVSLRELVKFLDREKQEIVYTNLEDEIQGNLVSEKPLIQWGKNLKPYRDRVEAYLRKNQHHLTVQKLRTNQPITASELEELERILFDGDERGTKEDFTKEYGDRPLGQFVRSILGMERPAAMAAFAEFIQRGNPTGAQITFIDNIITHLEQNGTISATMLFEPPFTDVNDQGLMGVFDDADSVRVISIIEEVELRALAS